MYAQALRPVNGGVPGVPSPAQQLLELGDALLTVNGAQRRDLRGAGVQGVQGVQGVHRGAGVAGSGGSGGGAQGQEGRRRDTTKGH